MSAPVKLILTGGRGVIGTAISQWMRANHPEVEVVQLLPFPFSLSAVHGALCSGHVKYFVNCAGEARDADSLLRPFDFFEVNSFGVIKQLELLRQHAKSVRYLNFGSVYEATHITPYASSKRIAREAIANYRQNFGLYALTATLALTESNDRPVSYLSKKIVTGVARIAAAIKAGQSFEPLTLRDIDQEYVFTAAEDVADGVWRMLNQEFFSTGMNERATRSWAKEYGSGEADYPWHFAQQAMEYTLSRTDSHSLREFVELAFNEAGINWHWVDGPDGEVLVPLNPISSAGFETMVRATTTVDENAHYPSESPLWDDDFYTAQSDLGWTPKHSFPDIVRMMTRYELDRAGL